MSAMGATRFCVEIRLHPIAHSSTTASSPVLDKPYMLARSVSYIPERAKRCSSQANYPPTCKRSSRNGDAERKETDTASPEISYSIAGNQLQHRRKSVTASPEISCSLAGNQLQRGAFRLIARGVLRFKETSNKSNEVVSTIFFDTTSLTYVSFNYSITTRVHPCTSGSMPYWILRSFV